MFKSKASKLSDLFQSKDFSPFKGKLGSKSMHSLINPLPFEKVCHSERSEESLHLSLKKGENYIDASLRSA